MSFFEFQLPIPEDDVPIPNEAVQESSVSFSYEDNPLSELSEFLASQTNATNQDPLGFQDEIDFDVNSQFNAAFKAINGDIEPLPLDIESSTSAGIGSVPPPDVTQEDHSRSLIRMKEHSIPGGHVSTLILSETPSFQSRKSALKASQAKRPQNRINRGKGHRKLTIASESFVPPMGHICKSCKDSGHSDKCKIAKGDLTKFWDRYDEVTKGDTNHWTEWSLNPRWYGMFPICDCCRRNGIGCDFKVFRREEITGRGPLDPVRSYIKASTLPATEEDG